MVKYVAEVLGQDYFFEINADNLEDAHATAVEHVHLIGIEEWVEHLSITEDEG